MATGARHLPPLEARVEMEQECCYKINFLEHVVHNISHVIYRIKIQHKILFDCYLLQKTCSPLLEVFFLTFSKRICLMSKLIVCRLYVYECSNKIKRRGKC